VLDCIPSRPQAKCADKLENTQLGKEQKAIYFQVGMRLIVGNRTKVFCSYYIRVGTKKDPAGSVE